MIWRVALGIGVGILATPPALLLAFISAGGGHGDYLWAKAFFPYTMVLPELAGSEIYLPLIIMAFLQFPLYGLMVGLSASSPRRACTVAGIILAAHLAIAAFCIGFNSKCFS
jgi:hypothetical protein